MSHKAVTNWSRILAMLGELRPERLLKPAACGLRR